ncbi:MAG TPA: A/G-specific adenine glycosylase [Gammaproteobacteria bacterium]|nr:A/G-specific adenine glycosylase [Gammaproteobacteria bacterium]
MTDAGLSRPRAARASHSHAPVAPRLLAWFDVHGRHDLPWQRERTPYTVWVSEVMLQQTQVATVVPFYERFVARFPTVEALAAAPLDDVLKVWSGLGYYARARNLWNGARVVVAKHGGCVPQTFDELEALPGIGRSTAGAILAQACASRFAILDGNVKRVLARHHAVEGWPGEHAVQEKLWALAEGHTPHERVADYTQAIMDLGATLCTRARPACTVCPLADTCAAARAGTQAKYPAPRPKRPRARRSVTVLVVEDPAGCVLLARRPERGIWGGLYSFPELANGDTAAEWCARTLGANVAVERALATIEHGFTHFDLDLEPRWLRLATAPRVVQDCDDFLWQRPSAAPAVGIPAPVAALFGTLAIGAHDERAAPSGRAALSSKEL